MDKRSWYLRNKEKTDKQMILLKSNPCVDCGQRFPHYVMEWDHVPERGKKKFVLSRMTSNRKINNPVLLEELAKCDLVCSNCHSTRTHFRKLKSE